MMVLMADDVSQTIEELEQQLCQVQDEENQVRAIPCIIAS